MFKKRARTSLGDMASSRPRLKSQNAWPESQMLAISLLSVVIETDAFSPIFNFIKDYTRKKPQVTFGYLYESIPSVSIPPLQGISRLTKKENSPYFCAKINLAGMGDAFLIPYSLQPFEYVLVIRPVREYRQSVRFMGNVISPSRFQLLHPPFDDLDDVLLALAIQHEAHVF